MDSPFKGVKGCEDPSCMACQLARLYPEEHRVAVIYHTAQVMDLMCMCMSQAHQKTNTLGQVLEALGAEDQKTRLYNQIFDQLFAANLEQRARGIMVLVQTCFALLPTDIMDAARATYMARLEAAGKASGETDGHGFTEEEIRESLDLAKQYIKDLEQGGQEYLVGITGQSPLGSTDTVQ